MTDETTGRRDGVFTHVDFFLQGANFALSLLGAVGQWGEEEGAGSGDGSLHAEPECSPRLLPAPRKWEFRGPQGLLQILSQLLDRK